MPRQERQIPARLDRFNYWRFSRITPRPVEEIRLFPHDWAEQHAKQLTQQQFRQHLDGLPCGIAGCKFDQKLQEGLAVDARPYLALTHYVKSNALWREERTAQVILKRLLPQEQDAISTLHKATWDRYKRRQWDALLQRIARDQLLFEEVMSLNRRHVVEDALETVAKGHAMSEDAVRDIYRAYSAQRQFLLGEIKSHRVRNALADRSISPNPISLPTIPRRQTPFDRDATECRPFFDGEGRVVDYDTVGTEIPAEQREQMVFHWFAHSLRNLRRWKNGKAPLPWQDTCARQCLGERDKLANR